MPGERGRLRIKDLPGFGFGEFPDWYDDAACQGESQDVFFTNPGESTAEAKRICRKCPVRKECLELALLHNEQHGVWGGLSSYERKEIRRERKHQTGR